MVADEKILDKITVETKQTSIWILRKTTMR